MPVELQRHQPAATPTSRDLVRVQENAAKAISDLQLGSLVFVDAAPSSPTSPGTPKQAFLDPTDATLYVCYAVNRWARYYGAVAW